MVELSTADEANVQGNEAFANQRIDDAIEVLMPPSADSCPHSDPKMDPPLTPPLLHHSKEDPSVSPHYQIALVFCWMRYL
jgi:hypothetical protein